jgi:tetratricopeptide (TPR) repeat protein
MNLGRCDEALGCYEKALTLDPLFAAAWTNKGAVSAKLGWYGQALESNERALQLDPSTSTTDARRSTVRPMRARNASRSSSPNPRR